jgi:hypothetical protein
VTIGTRAPSAEPATPTASSPDHRHRRAISLHRRSTAQVRPQTVNKHFSLMAAVFKLAHDDLLRSRGIDNPFASLRKAAVQGY